MNINEILSLVNDVKPYDKGTDVMWTDSHISKHLLQAHINPDINLASRKPSSIDKIVDFIIKELDKNTGDILDLGCGPGLYSNRFAKKGFNVTGVDFSENSISYAKKEAKKDNLDINYICSNYLEIELDNQYDAIIMIYCDFGVLSIEEREKLINKIHSALKPGGIFIFDALNEKSIKNINLSQNWEVSNGGFWKETPYLCLSQSFHFSENKSTLDQHIVFDESNNYKLYRFWNHYFDKKDIENTFLKFGFKSVVEFSNMLENDGTYNDEGVNFYKILK